MSFIVLTRCFDGHFMVDINSNLIKQKGFCSPHQSIRHVFSVVPTLHSLFSCTLLNMSFQAAAFAFLFPGNAMTNSILATAYISIFPNLLLYFVPPDINTGSLNVLVSFAVGKSLSAMCIG